MAEILQLGDLDVNVVIKDIKNIHLSVHPPSGRVTIAAPQRMEMEAIRLFAISKLEWIKNQQRKLTDQERETPRDYLERESHYVWGKRYLLRVEETNRRPSVELQHSYLVLQVRPGSDESKRHQIIEDWYREQVKTETAKLIAKWEPEIGVEINDYYVRRMKTRWGSCNSLAGTIWLNTDLAKKPLECLEYIVVHEMVHILERTHNERFQAHMRRFMPDWSHRRQLLNTLPLRHVGWRY